MYFVDNDSSVEVMPPVGAALYTKIMWFTERGAGGRATYPGPDWFNIIQAEMMNIISAAGMELKKDDNTQLTQAIKKIIDSGEYYSEDNPPPYPVTSVNTKTGAVTLTAADVGALPDTYVPPAAPVTSVNTKTGAVTLTAADVGALPDTYVPPSVDLSPYETIADANARFVQGIRLSELSSRHFDTSVGYEDGAVFTNMDMVGGSSNVGNVYVRYIQQDINGVWAVIGRL